MLKYKLKTESEYTDRVSNCVMPQHKFKIESEFPQNSALIAHQQHNIKIEAAITEVDSEKLDKIMRLKKDCRRFKDLLEPLIDLSQPNVTTIMQRPVDMGETKRYKRKNYEDLEKRRVYQCKYPGKFKDFFSWSRSF